MRKILEMLIRTVQASQPASCVAVIHARGSVARQARGARFGFPNGLLPEVAVSKLVELIAGRKLGGVPAGSHQSCHFIGPSNIGVCRGNLAEIGSATVRTE